MLSGGDGTTEQGGERGRSAAHRGLLVLALVGSLALVVIGVFTTPDERGYGTHEQLGLPACRARDWFGVPCPACGTTTAVSNVLRGRPIAGLRAQPLGFALAVGWPLFALWALRVCRTGGDLGVRLARVRRRWWIAAGLFAAASWVSTISRS